MSGVQRRSSSRVSATHQLRVLIADDDRILRDSLSSVLSAHGCKIVASVQDGRRAIELARRQRPDIAVLDASMPVMGGLDAAREIIVGAHRTAVLLVTENDDEWIVHEALRIGIRGLLLKAQGLTDLVQAIRDVSQGAIYISAVFSRSVLGAFAHTRGHRPNLLSNRELQMLRQISDGKTMKEAAKVMGISVRTAECHRAHIMRKLRIHDTAGLVRYAIRQGLVVA
jgi:two-component system response regulator NreC